MWLDLHVFSRRFILLILDRICWYRNTILGTCITSKMESPWLKKKPRVLYIHLEREQEILYPLLTLMSKISYSLSLFLFHIVFNLQMDKFISEDRHTHKHTYTYAHTLTRVCVRMHVRLYDCIYVCHSLIRQVQVTFLESSPPSVMIDTSFSKHIGSWDT